MANPHAGGVLLVACAALSYGLLTLGCGDPDSAVDATGKTATATRTMRASVTPLASRTVEPAATPVSPPGVVYATETPPSPPLATVTSGDPPPSPPEPWGAPDPALGAPPYFSTERLTPADLAARGRGAAGRGALNIAHVIVPRIEADATVSAGVVGLDGRMPSPPTKDEVVWYDFSNYPGLGGLPDKGGNVVLAGDAGRPGLGPGVFAKLGRVAPGDFVRLRLTTGDAACYRVEWNKLATLAEVDLFDVVAATAEESITLITGGAIGEWRFVWGRRASCAAEPALTPTPAPPPGHHKLKLAIEGRRILVLDGGTVPPDKHTIDYTLEFRDIGVSHIINIFAPNGQAITANEAIEGPTTLFGVFGRADGPGTYQFRCNIHPEMVVGIAVQ
jgi:hypothetical protein